MVSINDAVISAVITGLDGWATQLPVAAVRQGNNIFHQSPGDYVKLRSEVRLWLGQEFCVETPQVARAQKDLWACTEQPLPVTSFLFVSEAARVAPIHHLDTSTLHCLVT